MHCRPMLIILLLKRSRLLAFFAHFTMLMLKKRRKLSHLISSLCHQQVTLYCTSLAIMAFNAHISDPRVGGTYLTLLNTLTNLGGNWCQTLALWLVDGLTWTNCLGANIPGLHCSSKTSAKVQAIILEMLSFCIVIFLCFNFSTKDQLVLITPVHLTVFSEPCRFSN